MSYTADQSATADQLVDRRRLRRRLTLWRALAFVGLALAIVALGWRVVGARGGAGSLVPHIARLSIGGLIVGDRETIELVDDVAKSNAAAVLVEIDSPGGTTSGSERLYQALRRLSSKKPTVAVVRGLAASGAYIAAIGTDHIVAQTTSLVGSIGVLFQFPNVGGALDKIGVKVETIKSSPLKASPNGFEPTSPEAKAAIDALVVDSYGWFKGLVKERRAMSDAQLAAVDDGRVFTGGQGLGLHLVDAIGEERDAIAYLETARGVAKSLPVLDWKKESAFGGLGLFGASATVARALGLPDLAGVIERTARLAEARSVDGMLAIWQVPSGT
jgi:protease-4